MGKVREGSRSESMQVRPGCQALRFRKRKSLFEISPVVWWIFDLPEIVSDGLDQWKRCY